MSNRTLKNKSNTTFINPNDIKLKSLSIKDIIKKGGSVFNNKDIIDDFKSCCNIYNFLLIHGFDLKKVESSKTPYEFMNFMSIVLKDLEMRCENIYITPINTFDQTIQDLTLSKSIELAHTAGLIRIGDEPKEYKKILYYGYKLIHKLGFDLLYYYHMDLNDFIYDEIKNNLIDNNDYLEDDEKQSDEQIEGIAEDEYNEWRKEYNKFLTNYFKIIKTKRKPKINYSEIPECLFTWITLLEFLTKAKFNIKHYKPLTDDLNYDNNIEYTYGFIPANDPVFETVIDSNIQMIFENDGNPVLQISTIFEDGYKIVQDDIPLEEIITLIFSFDTENVTYKNHKNYERDFKKVLQTVESYISLQK